VVTCPRGQILPRPQNRLGKPAAFAGSSGAKYFPRRIVGPQTNGYSGNVRQTPNRAISYGFAANRPPVEDDFAGGQGIDTGEKAEAPAVPPESGKVAPEREREVDPIDRDSFPPNRFGDIGFEEKELA